MCAVLLFIFGYFDRDVTCRVPPIESCTASLLIAYNYAYYGLHIIMHIYMFMFNMLKSSSLISPVFTSPPFHVNFQFTLKNGFALCIYNIFFTPFGHRCMLIFPNQTNSYSHSGHGKSSNQSRSHSIRHTIRGMSTERCHFPAPFFHCFLFHISNTYIYSDTN